MLKGFAHARLACGCRLAFREGSKAAPSPSSSTRNRPGVPRRCTCATCRSTTIARRCGRHRLGPPGRRIRRRGLTPRRKRRQPVSAKVRTRRGRPAGGRWAAARRPERAPEQELDLPVHAAQVVVRQRWTASSTSRSMRSRKGLRSVTSASVRGNGAGGPTCASPPRARPLLLVDGPVFRIGCARAHHRARPAGC